MKKCDFFKNAGVTVAVMIFATLIAKVLGMARQMMTAGIFAASMEGIAFSAASKIPLAIFDMLFSTAVLGSFLPIYKGHLDRDQDRAKRFSSAFLSCIALITAIVALLGIIFSKEIIFLAAPNLDEETASLAAALLRIMFPAMIFAGMAYTLIGILQSHESFLLPAFVSAISNLVLIGYLAFCPREVDAKAAYGLATAYLLSWAVQFLTLALPLFGKGTFPVPTLRFKNGDLLLSLRRALPVMFGSWLLPVTTLIAGAFSSYIPGDTIEVGVANGAAIVVYENAFSVFTIAAGLLTYGICNYIFPKLSARAASGDKDGFARLIHDGLFSSLALILPITAAVFLLSDQIIGLLYLRGSFTESLAMAAGKSLRMLALAMPAYGITEFLSRVCYSCGKVKYPMFSAIAGIMAELVFSFAVYFAGGLSVSAVALGSAIGQIAAAAFLLIVCLRKFRSALQKDDIARILFLPAGTVLSALTMNLFCFIVKQFEYFSVTFENFITIAIVFVMGIVVYLIWLIIIKIIFFHKNNPERGKSFAKQRKK